MEEEFVFEARYRVLAAGPMDLPRRGLAVPDGLEVGIESSAGRYAVVLLFGDGEYHSRTFCASTPCPDRLLVVVQGAAYLVDTLDPDGTVDLNAYAASAAVAFVERSMLVVVDLTRVIGVDEGGERWDSGSLSDDAIRFVGQDEDRLRLEIYSAEDGRWETRTYLVSRSGLERASI